MLTKINQFVQSTRKSTVPWLNKHEHIQSYASTIRTKYSNLTGPFHVYPDFLIIGVKKGGSTSLYRNLVTHPRIEPCLTKEVDYFNRYFRKGTNWYRSHFPLILFKKYSRKVGREFVTGEATPTYIYHPHAPKRIKKILPKVKLIVILRNPVDRAFSHYNMAVLHKNENLNFDEAIENEQKRIEGEFERMENDEDYFSYNFQTYSFLQSGMYAKQLKRWLEIFPKKQFLILKSEDFNQNPQIIFNQVFDFLNLPNWTVKKYKKFSLTSRNKKMDSNIRKKLIEYFKPHNQELYQLIGKNLDWDQ